MNGITDETLADQHKIIDSLNLETSCKILKSAECEVLSDGSLDLSEQSLKSLDYTIIAIHRDTCQIKPIVEKRLIKAIENPFSNSSRLFFSVQKSYVVYAISNSILSCAVRSFFNLLQ